MKRVAMIFAGLLLGLPALANQMPQHGELDSRMRYVAYNPGQVVHLSTEIGATLVVGFSDTRLRPSIATRHQETVPPKRGQA